MSITALFIKNDWLHVLHLLAIYMNCEWKHAYGISENTQELTTRATKFYIYLQ